MDFPSNSNTAKSTPEEEPKKIEKIVEGKVIHQKKSMGRRLMDTFIGGSSAQTVWQYVVFEVLVPAAKDALNDAVSQGFERLIFGESRSGNRGRRPMNYTSYTSFSRPTVASTPYRPEPREEQRRPRSTMEFEDIILATRVEAETVIGRLEDLIERYEVVTVSELYELVGITSTYTMEKYGWQNLAGARPTKVREGWLLELPKPQVLK